MTNGTGGLWPAGLSYVPRRSFSTIAKSRVLHLRTQVPGPWLAPNFAPDSRPDPRLRYAALHSAASQSGDRRKFLN